MSTFSVLASGRLTGCLGLQSRSARPAAAGQQCAGGELEEIASLHGAQCIHNLY